MGRKK
jgi:hypothetical protein